MGVALLQTFIKVKVNQCACEGGKHNQTAESPAPAQQVCEKAAHRHTSASNGTQSREGLRHDFGALHRLIQIANDGASCHDTRPHGHTLKRSRCNEGLNARRQYTSNRRNHINRDAAQQNGSAPPFV